MTCHRLIGLIMILFMSLSPQLRGATPTPPPTSLPTTQPQTAQFIRQLRAGTPQKIVFFGTSLTQGGAWPGQVREVLEAAFPKLVAFHNSAKGGENSTWGLANVQTSVIDQKPDVVFIEFTTNDAVDRFHLSVDEARANTEQIIDAIRKARPDCEIILQIMNPVTDRPIGHAGHRGKLEDYQQMYRDLCMARGLLLIDHMPAWRTLLAEGIEAFHKYVPDGLHPNAEGYAKYVTPTILTTLGLDSPKIHQKR